MQVNLKVKNLDRVTRYLQKRPERLKKMNAIALFEIGQQGAGHAKSVAPYVTGNLRRSITFDGAGNFPLLQPRQGELIPEMLGQSAAKVEDVVYIGTNLVYASIIYDDADGYRVNATYDFQMVLPEKGYEGWASATPYYFYIEIS